jgi:hypothetical protein
MKSRLCSHTSRAEERGARITHRALGKPDMSFGQQVVDTFFAECGKIEKDMAIARARERMIEYVMLGSE